MEGSADGLIELTNESKLYSMMIGAQSSNLLKMAGRPLSEDEIDEIRAKYIRDNIGELL